MKSFKKLYKTINKLISCNVADFFHSKSTQRAFQGHLDIRTLGHSSTQGTLFSKLINVELVCCSLYIYTSTLVHIYIYDIYICKWKNKKRRIKKKIDKYQINKSNTKLFLVLCLETQALVQFASTSQARSISINSRLYYSNTKCFAVL